MPSLALRNVSDETLQWLRLRAAQHRRSLNAELLDLIEVAKADELAQAHASHPVARAYLRTRARGVRTAPTSAAILRADRDRNVRP